MDSLARIVIDAENALKLEQVTTEIVSLVLETHGIRVARVQIQRPETEPVTVYSNPLPPADPDTDRGLAEGDPDS